MLIESRVSVTWDEFEPKFKEKYERGIRDYLKDFQDKIDSENDAVDRSFAEAKTALYAFTSLKILIGTAN